MSSGLGFRAVGIDFGTTTSLVAARAGLGRVEVLPLGGRQTTFPSTVGVRDGSFVVGEVAEELPPDQVIRSVKRAITRDLATVRVAGSAGTQVDVNADEVIVAVLSEVAARARMRNVDLRHEPVVRLGCPAAWDRQQRDRALRLAELAGIPVGYDTLVDEPVAAGLAWLTASYLASPGMVEGRLLVFDMGGGTLDIAVLVVQGGARPKVSVLSSSGLPWAGDALDQEIADTLAGQLGIDLADLPAPGRAEATLLLESRRAKERLSQRESHPIVLPRMFFGSKVPTLRLSRADLDGLFQPQMRGAEELIWHELRMARLTHTRGAYPDEIMRTPPDDLARDITHVLLAGGMSRIPYVRWRLRELFPHAEVFDHPDGVEPDEAIVAGLADTVGYDQLSMHRPSFDVSLEWREGHGRRVTLYQAYTPLYGRPHIERGSFLLGHTVRPDPAGLPQDGCGKLAARTPSGAPVVLVSPDERYVDGVPIRFGSHKMVFKLYTDGRIHLSDGAGFEHQLRAEGWEPVIGRDHVPLPRPVPDPVVPYPFNRED